MKLAGATSALVLLLAAALPSAADADESSGRPSLTCVAFESDEENPNFLHMGQCLTSGDAICSSTGSWIFGIDPADRAIKLWEGDQVSTIVDPIRMWLVLEFSMQSSGTAFLPT